MIETQIWDAAKPIGEQYLGQRKALEVFNEIKTELEKRVNSESDEISYDYIYLDMDFKEKDSLFPTGNIAIYATPGGSEGYRVIMMILDNNEYKCFMGVKLWSIQEALTVSNLLTKIVLL